MPQFTQLSDGIKDNSAHSNWPAGATPQAVEQLTDSDDALRGSAEAERRLAAAFTCFTLGCASEQRLSCVPILCY